MPFIRYLYIVFLVIIVNTLVGQESRFQIRYIGQIATQKDFSNNKSLLSYISDFIFGNTIDKLTKPFNLFGNKDGNIWILDQGNNCIMYTNSTKNIFNALSCEKYNFQSLVGICTINSDTILFSDSKLEKLFFFRKSDHEILPLLDTLSLNMPTGVAYNQKTNEIWVVETGVHQIKILTPNGHIKKKLGSRGTNNGEFNYPNFIWIDKKGTAYIVDSMNFRIQIFDADGNYISMFGEAGDASGFFAKPKGVATDSYGNIYVVDSIFNTVQIFDSDGNYLYSFGAKGSGTSDFMLPAGIYINHTDNIYVADSYNSRIQIFKLLWNDEVKNSIKN